MTPNKVRVTITDSMGRKMVHEIDIGNQRTPGIAAHDLIDALALRDGDTLVIDFLTV